MGLRRNENIVARQVHGAYLLVDITDHYHEDTCALYEINETGMFLWEHMDGDRTADQLAALLCHAVTDAADPTLIRRDVAQFVQLLTAKGFVEG